MENPHGNIYVTVDRPSTTIIAKSSLDEDYGIVYSQMWATQIKGEIKHRARKNRFSVKRISKSK